MDKIVQANVQSFLIVLFLSVSSVIRFLSSFVLLLDPFFDLFFIFFFFCAFLRFFFFSFCAYPFFGFLPFLFFLFWHNFFFSFVMCKMFLFSNSYLGFFNKKFWVLLLLNFYFFLMYEWSTIHKQIFNKKNVLPFVLFNKDITVNLYQLQFSSSHFSFQPNKKVFHFSTFLSFKYQIHIREN